MRIWKFLFTLNGVFNQKEVVSNQHVCTNDLRKMWASYIFNFSTIMQTITKTKYFNTFFWKINVAMSNNLFQLAKVPKTNTCKHISTKDSFKNKFRIRHVYIWHTITLNMKPVIPVGIFELMIVLKRYYCLYFWSLHD